MRRYRIAARADLASALMSLSLKVNDVFRGHTLGHDLSGRDTVLSGALDD